MKFHIDKSIPPPTKPALQKYPFPDMKVGDSIFVRGESAGNIKKAATVWGHRHNRVFISRREKDGFRIWRTQ